MSGLRYENICDLPEGARRQVIVKIVARKVAAEISEEERRKRQKADRLLALKDAALEGVITDLRVDHHLCLREAYTTPDGVRVDQLKHVADFTYRVQKPTICWPCCCGIKDVGFWHRVGKDLGEGTMVVENIYQDGSAVQNSKREAMKELGYVLREFFV